MEHLFLKSLDHWKREKKSFDILIIRERFLWPNYFIWKIYQLFLLMPETGQFLKAELRVAQRLLPMNLSEEKRVFEHEIKFRDQADLVISNQDGELQRAKEELVEYIKSV